MARDQLRRAVIIAVGSELLTPDRLDTNSLFLTQRLNELGVSVRCKLVIGDDPADIGAALLLAIPKADIVVITGGLGPTEDDVTREAVAAALGLPLEEDAEVAAAIRSRFAARGLPMPATNRRQALIPKGAAVLPNPNGTAPGLWIERPEVVCVVLPGPPRELHGMFDAAARSRLAPAAGRRGIFRRVLHVTGRTESYVDEAASPVYSRWRSAPVPIATSILASLGQIELHLAARAATPEDAARALDAATGELEAVLGRDLVSSDGASLEEVVGRLLRARGQRVAVAESCTGGLIASRLTDVPGSSAYVHGGWVAYDNAAKTAQLGVDRRMIEVHGAVSEPVARALAQGCRKLAGTDYGLGVTGIAGPGGGSPEKPVGTVYVALAGPGERVRVRHLKLPGERDRVKFQASQAALDLLRRALLD